MERIYEEDASLVQKRGMERSLSFRFGLYFHELVNSEGLHIDLEYNKNGDEPKRIPQRPHGVVPDFLFHSRGNNEQNTLVIEFKGWWNNDSRENDVIKLTDFVHQEGEYKYGLGILIEFNRDNFTLETFLDYEPENNITR
ncbi:hypothetical protein [Tenacibaculum sp. MAR_2009_124]|uniref:hypothetical protein n=1 Tax=Tenacibaculum sp. MAR_2009_124 TaxID=1250059 RepID=UPI0015A45E2F|nr:hypothetical protein [Tenacibaculum sp. MAR_2009_124]